MSTRRVPAASGSWASREAVRRCDHGQGPAAFPLVQSSTVSFVSLFIIGFFFRVARCGALKAKRR